MVRLIARNQVLLMARHFPDDWPMRSGWHVVLAQGLWGALALSRGRGMAWLRGKLEGMREYGDARMPGGHPGAVRAIAESERELRALQQNSPDLFWRVYFALTS